MLKPQNRAYFYETIDLRCHMPRFTLKMNIFPSISLETAYMCVETLRTGLVFPRQLIWGVTCQGLLWKWMFSHLSPVKQHTCMLKPSEQGLFFQDDQFEELHDKVYSKNECFPIYLLGNSIHVCWNPQNRACFPETIDLRGHMPRCTLKMSIFPSISLETT